VRSLKCKLYPETCRFMKTRQRNWHALGDPVSLGLHASPYKNKVMVPKSLNPHAVSQWYDL
jgi:hypothetical protein